MALSPIFSRHLSDRRKNFNARIAYARTRNPSFDIASFSSFLEMQADPLLNAALKDNGDAGVTMADAFFDMAVTLTELRWAGNGARSPLVNRLWSETAPAFAGVIAQNARETLGALSNAAIKLSDEPAVRMEQWLALLSEHGGEARTVKDVQNLISICAWRSGAAHARDAALKAAGALPSAVASAAVGAGNDSNWSELAGKFKSHRWWAPDASSPSEGQRVGEFTGFGGYFPQPPVIFVAGDMFFVQSADRHFAIFADAFGASLRPVSAGKGSVSFQPHQYSQRRLEGEQIRADDRLVPLAFPATDITIAETSDSIAVTSPVSHSIHIFPKAMP